MRFKLLKNKEKTQEKSTGRSMVEMLGVLAIIGVLSIGGIQGYTIAMRKYRANEIVSLMAKYATIGYTAFQNYAQNNEVFLRNDHHFFKQIPVYHHANNRDSDCYASKCGIPEFINAGLGGFPVGVSNIFIWAITSATNENGSTAPYDDKNVPASDYVAIRVNFTDKELCKTVASLTSGYVAITGSDEADVVKTCEWKELEKQIPVN